MPVPGNAGDKLAFKTAQTSDSGSDTLSIIVLIVGIAGLAVAGDPRLGLTPRPRVRGAEEETPNATTWPRPSTVR